MYTSHEKNDFFRIAISKIGFVTNFAAFNKPVTRAHL